MVARLWSARGTAEDIIKLRRERNRTLFKREETDRNSVPRRREDYAKRESVVVGAAREQSEKYRCGDSAWCVDLLSRVSPGRGKAR